MPTAQNKIPGPKWYCQAFLSTTRVLLIVLAGGLLLVVPASAQRNEAPDTKAGTILGTVIDATSDPIPGATVVLQGPAGNHLTSVTKDDGSFAFQNVAPGIAYQITVAAEGFGEWSSSVTVEPGQEKTLTDVTLHILAVQRAVTVTYSSTEIAAQQLKAEEHQRLLGFIPNIYVTYEPHPEPLTTGMKFHLAYKGLTHPTFFAFEAAWAGVEQAAVLAQRELEKRRSPLVQRFRPFGAGIF
jgi:carboxypeptidase family protein